MMIITLVSWIGALLVAKLLRMTVIRGESTPFVMELPPYRLPTFKGLFIHTLEKTLQYIRKAGTVILGISIILWAMMTFPGLPASEHARFVKEKEQIIASAAMVKTPDINNGVGNKTMDSLSPVGKKMLAKLSAENRLSALKYSFAGRLGSSMEKVTSFAGFDWRTNIALLGGFAAKEVIVSTLATAYSLGDINSKDAGSLKDSLRANPAFRPLVAFSLIIFTIFYAPCFVTVVCIAREAGSWKWDAFSVVLNTTIALGLSVTVYQVGRLLGF